LSFIELNRDVRTLSESDGRFVLELHGRTITANEVVVATGPFQTAYVPKIAASLEPGVWQPVYAPRKPGTAGR
jgi:putative flavoprotein involved in K+ transport